MATNSTDAKQQPQHPKFNHPLEFDGERRDYIRVVVPLHRALAKGDLKRVEEIFKDHEDLVRYSISANKETPLHVAIMSQSTECRLSLILTNFFPYHTRFPLFFSKPRGFPGTPKTPLELVRYLVGKMSEADLKLQNSDGNTAFCLAAISGNVDMADIMVKKNPALSLIYATENTMPLCLAAFHGKHKMVDFLFHQSNKMKGYGWTKMHRNVVLLKCIQANMLEFAIQILNDNKELPQDKYALDVLQELAQKPEEFKKSTSLIGRARSCFLNKPAEKNTATKLLGLLLERVTEKLDDITHEIPKTKRDQIKTYLSQILFMAAKENNKIFLVELIDKYPDLIWQRNDKGQTIFHIAVDNRNGDVFNLVRDIGSMKDFITSITDKEGNNILHKVGKIPEKICYQDSEVTSYEVLWEYFWYEDVKHTLPESSREVKNEEGDTPLEVFTKTHREPISQSTKWIYDIIGQSMVLAALVCTIGFSIAYSLPGGFDQNTGLPLFNRSKPYIAFIILLSASFCMSGISMLAFLSIVLSRFEKCPETIIRRWMTAQQTLLLSLGTLVMAFISSFFLLYPNNIFPYIITVIASVLFAIYIKQHKSFVMVGVNMTFKVWFFNWTANPRIYHRNPTY